MVSTSEHERNKIIKPWSVPLDLNLLRFSIHGQAPHYNGQGIITYTGTMSNNLGHGITSNNGAMSRHIL